MAVSSEINAALVIGFKSIYTRLVMAAAKGTNVNQDQSMDAQESYEPRRVEVKNEQWQSLSRLQKQIRQEHHDIFLASKHPSASAAMTRPAAKYSMPARMRCRGIHAIFEVLRHRLPEPLEHMLAFIYIAYSMMALLYESVPAIENIWIDNLGGLGRYRMPCNDDQLRSRKTWSQVAKYWYSEASEKTANVERLSHHLVIFTQTRTLVQLSLYTKSLTCLTVSESVREVVLSPFDQVLDFYNSNDRQSASLGATLVRHHAVLCHQQVSKPLFDNLIGSLNLKLSLRNLFWRMAEVSKVIPIFVPKGSGLFIVACAAALELLAPVACEYSPNIKMVESPPDRTEWQRSRSLFIGGPYVIFAMIILLLAYSVANRKGRIPVWECMMAIWAFAWWRIQESSNADLWLSAT